MINEVLHLWVENIFLRKCYFLLNDSLTYYNMSEGYDFMESKNIKQHHIILRYCGLCLFGLILNLVLSNIVKYFNLPLYLDNVGSILTGALGGALPGMCVGFLSNVMNSFDKPISLYYGILTIVMAALASYFSSRGYFKKISSCFLIALLFSCIGGAIGSVFTWILYGGGIGGLGGPLATMIMHMGIPAFFAQILADLILDIPDKLITIMIVYILLKVYPHRLYDFYQYSYLYDRSKEKIEVYEEAHDDYSHLTSLQISMLNVIIVVVVVISVTALGLSCYYYLVEKSLAIFIIRLLTVLFGLSMLISALAANYIEVRLVKPIRIIVHMARQFKKVGALDWLSSEELKDIEPIKTGDEIQELYETVYENEKRVAQSMVTMKETERKLIEARDIDLKNRELEIAIQEAKAANKAKSLFMSNVSHDMRTLLNSLIGFTQIAKETDDPIIKADCLKKIDQSATYLLGLINDTLDLSRMETGKLQLDIQPLDLKTSLKHVIDNNSSQAYNKGITLTLDETMLSSTIVDSDQLRIEEILNNIIGNSVKFTHECGYIKVAVRTLSEDEKQENIEFLIADNGIGISQEFLPHLFEPFTQENPIENKNFTGSGLGLSIVKNIIDMLHGEIKVSSQLGKGTTFSIILPLAVSKTQSLKHEEVVTDYSILKGKHILLCEDNPNNVELARFLLKKQGVIVSVAGNGQIAKETYLSHDPMTYDAILMDIRMPVMNGYEATKAIRSSSRPDAKILPIIAMTANVYDEDRQKGQEAGMNAQLSKPINVKEFYQALCTMIDNHKSTE